MADQPISAGTAYSYKLLEEWYQIADLSKQFRRNCYLGRSKDITTRELQADLVAALSHMWGELYPKVMGDPKFKDMQTQYASFQAFFDDVREFKKDEESGDRITEIELLLRRVLEKIPLTRFEG